MKAFKNILTLVLTGALLASCSLIGQSQTKELSAGQITQDGPVARQLNILTTVRLLADMVNDLSDGQHIVRFMTDSEAALKGSPPSPGTLEEANYNSFFYVGAGYEPFIPEFIEQIDKNKINVVNVSRGVEILRYQNNKLDDENHYYLMNSTNYKIALNSIKNSLQEMDPARKTLYDERFVELSREIDDFQKQVGDFIQRQDQVIYLVDSELSAYLVEEYQSNYQLISEYIERRMNESASTQTVSSQAGSIPGAENRLFLYTEEISLQKYGDDIVKYGLIPVRISLYDETVTLRQSFWDHFEQIRTALDPGSP